MEPGQPASSRLCIAAYSLAFIVFGIQVNILGPTIADLARQAGVIEADLGPVFTVTGLLSSIGAIPSGWLVDKLPGHLVLAASLAFQAAGFVVLPYCTTLLSIDIAFGIVSLTWNFVNTAVNTLILWQSRGRQGGALVNLIHAVFGAGSLCAPLLAELSAVSFGSSLVAYWITAGLSAASAASFLLLPSPLPPCSNSDSSDSTDTDGRNGSSKARRQLEWGQARLWLVLVPAILYVWLSVGTEVAIGGWIFTWAVQYAGNTEHQAQLLNAAYWAAFTAGRVIASIAATLLAPATMLLVSMPLAALGAGIAVAVPASSLTGLLALACTVLCGLGVSTGFANILSLLDSYAHIQGWVTGLLGGVSGAGCMVIPLVVALLAKHTALGYQSLMWLTILSIAAQTACLLLVLMAGRHVRSSSRTGDTVLEDGAEEAQREPLLNGDAGEADAQDGAGTAAAVLVQSKQTQQQRINESAVPAQ